MRCFVCGQWPYSMQDACNRWLRRRGCLQCLITYPAAFKSSLTSFTLHPPDVPPSQLVSFLCLITARTISAKRPGETLTALCTTDAGGAPLSDTGWGWGGPRVAAALLQAQRNIHFLLPIVNTLCPFIRQSATYILLITYFHRVLWPQVETNNTLIDRGSISLATITHGEICSVLIWSLEAGGMNFVALVMYLF